MESERPSTKPHRSLRTKKSRLLICRINWAAISAVRSICGCNTSFSKGLEMNKGSGIRPNKGSEIRLNKGYDRRLD